MNKIQPQREPNFEQELKFLSNHFDTVRLESVEGEGQAIVIPALQGRVMTSSCNGPHGDSFGWINYDLVKKGIQPEDQREGLQKQIHVFGGEERFWLGPEGGQFGLFFPKSAPDYQFEYWKTPSLIDTQEFEEIDQGKNFVKFQTRGTVTNRFGTEFDLSIKRHVQVLSRKQIAELVGVKLDPELKLVAFQTVNELSNVGGEAWKRDSGLPSIWLLGMFKPDPSVVMVVPYLTQSGNPVCNSDYFQIPGKDRLVTNEQSIFFKGDGKFRSKIGVPASRATPFCGSYSKNKKTLTLVHYNLPEKANKQPYVKSQWQDHDEPYFGDVINCYNDGAPEPGLPPLGPFYELESSSPALELNPNESYQHIQTTIHLQGDQEALDPIAIATLKSNIEQINCAFG